FVLLTLAFCFRQNNTNPTLSKSISDILLNYHYEPKDINDKFSKELFNLYLKRWDSDKRFFLKIDVDSLKSFETKLDDDIKVNNFEFLNRVNIMHVARLSRAEAYYKEF